MDVQQYNVTVAAAAESNPVGVWSGAPSLAASTVDMVNTSGHDVEVTVTGGTVTFVKKNGATMATATGATVRLRPGHVLNLTYSVAPTLQWTYA
jgi:hypothetical protein